ncbi:MAG: hypothetical protein II008_13705, partial [Oscillospiraceae bacterium]|nr:hypothetical protein [Oscillospiraceae bacterium]
MTREQIRQAADIVLESISAKDYAAMIGLPVNRAGFTQCPFHSGDHDASLKLYDGRKGFHCFGCGASGDVIELAKRYYSLSFPQAVAKVANDAGIALPGTGEMTYDQARAYQAAQDRKAALLKAQAEEQAIESQYFDTLDAYMEINNHFDDMDAELTPIVLAGIIPPDDKMDDFFNTFAAKLAVNPA